jgi:hypothetical protein
MQNAKCKCTKKEKDAQIVFTCPFHSINVNCAFVLRGDDEDRMGQGKTVLSIFQPISPSPSSSPLTHSLHARPIKPLAMRSKFQPHRRPSEAFFPLLVLGAERLQKDNKKRKKGAIKGAKGLGRERRKKGKIRANESTTHKKNPFI